MPICPRCGANNRDAARFCYQCASSLQAQPARPSSDDHAWLAATLSGSPASDPAKDIAISEAPTESQAAPAQEPTDQRGMTMDQPQQPPAAPELFAGRYEIVARQGEQVEALDRQPWERCWACGATSNEAGELFCIECGASLEGRRYRGALANGEPSGLGLVPLVADPAAREALPQIWDQQQDGEEILTLVVDSGRSPIAPPLEELDALHVGLGLARLLRSLHAEGFALGEIAPADVELTAAGTPRLRATPNLRRAALQEGAASDLKALAGLIEALTATPRTTQRLAEEQAAELAEQPGIPGILRALRTGEVADVAALTERLEELLAERTSPLPLRVRVGATSHVGVIREIDEDSLLTLSLQMDQNGQGRSWGLYIVADGMGGHSAGEIASGLAIRGAAESVMRAYLTPTLEMDAVYEEARLKDVVHKAIVQANEYVLREAQARSNDMGTTITMAVVAGDRAVIGNVGDSRTYIYRDGALRRVSKDHSLVMRLVELGQITDDEVYTHPQRNAVLRSLGDKAEIEIDIFTERLRPGDALFLCSDGQWEMTHDPQMVEIIKQHDDPQAACDALIAAGNANGGEDNITSVLVKFEKYGG